MSNNQYNHMDVTTWPYFKPTIIAHDVGRSRDDRPLSSAAEIRIPFRCSRR